MQTVIKPTCLFDNLNDRAAEEVHRQVAQWKSWRRHIQVEEDTVWRSKKTP